MSDTSVTTEAAPQTSTPVVTPPLMNTETVRQPDGTIKDQSQIPPKSDTSGSSETKVETQPEVKPEGEVKPEAQVGAPEAYAEFKAPEGYQLSKDIVEAALPVFKELNLTQDQAQRLVNLQAEMAKKSAAAPQQEYETTRQNWRKDVLADPKLGNNGDLRPEVKTNLASFKSAIGDAALVRKFEQAMDITGVGDNPDFIRVISAMGEKFKEGAAVKGNGPSAAGQTAPDAKPKSIASAMYPNLV